MNRYEEYRTVGNFWGWVMLLVLGAALIAFGMVAHHLVPDQPSRWDYGTLADAPSESIYSTVPFVPTAEPPRVIAPLPGATLNVQLEAQEWKPMTPPEERGRK